MDLQARQACLPDRRLRTGNRRQAADAHKKMPRQP
jgi:hypothetical protein